MLNWFQLGFDLTTKHFHMVGVDIWVLDLSVLEIFSVDYLYWNDTCLGLCWIFEDIICRGRLA